MLKKTLRTFPSIFTSAAAVALSGGVALADGPIQTAQNLAPVLKLEIMSNCQDGAANFRIRNAGETWPKSAEFELFGLDADGSQNISKRKLRLKEGQRVTFKVPSKRNNTGRVGIYVRPAWYDRDFSYDATVDCR